MATRRPSARRLTALAAPLVVIGSLTPVALAQPVLPGAPVPPSPLQFAEEAARGLATSHLWSGPTDAATLSRDATRRDLVTLMQTVLRLPAGPIGSAWRDIATDDPQGAAARIAVQSGWLTTPGGSVSLDAPLTGRDANRAWTLGLGMRRAVARLSRFTDDSGRRFAVPAGFATSITAREAGLHRNYPSADDGLERHDSQPMRLADLVFMASQGALIRRGGLPSSVRALEAFRVPAIHPMFVPTVQRALSQVGNAYVWGGEWTGTESPLDPQAAGGFDCSGLVWYVWYTGNRAAEAAINVPDGRTTYTMNVGRRGKRIAWQSARAGDLVFFGDRGRTTPLDQASHTAISLGNKWIIHSSGGRAGVSITFLGTYWLRGLMNARRFAVAEGTPAVPDPPVTTPIRPTPLGPEPTTPIPQLPAAGGGGAQAPQPVPAPPGPQPPAPA